jgi:hypothetical protein
MDWPQLNGIYEAGVSLCKEAKNSDIDLMQDAFYSRARADEAGRPRLPTDKLRLERRFEE